MNYHFLEAMFDISMRDYAKARTLTAKSATNVANVIAADFYNRMREAFPPDSHGRDSVSIYNREAVEAWVDGADGLYAKLNRPVFQALKNEEIILTCGAGYVFTHSRIRADLENGQLMSE